jgi:hypothetical protein
MKKIQGKKWFLVLGAALLAVGMYLMSFASDMVLVKPDITVGGTAGTACIVAGVIFLLRAKRGQPLIDERVRAVSNKAYSWSWYLSFLLVAVLVWFDLFNPGLLTVQAVLGLLLFSLSLSAIGLKWWFDKHPEKA